MMLEEVLLGEIKIEFQRMEEIVNKNYYIVMWYCKC